MSRNDETRMSMIRRAGTNDEVALALKGLALQSPAIDRDQLMVDAGWAAAHAARGLAPGFWKASTGMMTAATVALALMLSNQNPGEGGSPPGASVGSPAATAHASDTAPVAPHAPVAEATSPALDRNSDSVERFSTPPRFGDPANNYLALRDAVLRRGLDDWPVNYGSPGANSESGDTQTQRATTARELLEQMLPKDRTDEAPTREKPLGQRALHKELTV